MTYSWNFIDLLIILISIALTTRFNQINHRLLTSRNVVVANQFWNDILTHYCALIELVDEIDEQFSLLILISAGQNAFTLCTKIFESLVG
jgi:gustatory receptor